MSDDEGPASDDDLVCPAGSQFEEARFSLDTESPLGAPPTLFAPAAPIASAPVFDLEFERRGLREAYLEVAGVAFSMNCTMQDAGLNSACFLDVLFHFSKHPLEVLLKHLQPLYRKLSGKPLTLTMMPFASTARRACTSSARTSRRRARARTRAPGATPAHCAAAYARDAAIAARLRAPCAKQNPKSQAGVRTRTWCARAS